MDIFAKKTNIEIKNRFISFDVSELPRSIQTTGYLVVLEHIMNRLKRNKSLGKHTWIFIDEFHILLANQYSSDYIRELGEQLMPIGMLVALDAIFNRVIQNWKKGKCYTICNHSKYIRCN